MSRYKVFDCSLVNALSTHTFRRRNYAGFGSLFRSTQPFRDRWRNKTYTCRELHSLILSEVVLYPNVGSFTYARYYSSTTRKTPSSTALNAYALNPLLEVFKKSDTVYADSFADLISLVTANESESLRYSGRLTESQATQLGEELEQNNRLLILDLRWNDINDKTALAISRSLSKNDSLISLDVSQNNITAVGALALAQSMIQEQQTSILFLSENPLGCRQGLQDLVKNTDHYLVF